MTINKLCFCCNALSSFYQNSNTGKIAAYCLDCNSKFSPVEKRKREHANIFKILISSKDINEKVYKMLL
jgi:hypothetical protein